MKQLNKFCLLAILSLFSNCGFADPIADVYHVEVIVFEHTDAGRFRSENWPKFAGKLDHSRAVDLDRLSNNAPESLDTLEVLDALDEAGEKPVAKITSESINLVDAKNYILKNELKTIKASKDERFIKHVAWNQPMANNVKSTPVYFTGGKDQEIAALISIKPNRNIFAVNLNLIYKLQPEDQKLVSDLEEIKITRDVKVKKKEVFYIDHPVIGVIITISPVIYGSNSYSPLPNL